MASRTDNGRWRPTVSAAGARRIVDAAVAKARSSAVPVTVAVVDESGVLKEFERMDGAALVSVQTATSKAYAAAAIGMPSDEFYGAIGVAGAMTGAEDRRIAEAALNEIR